MKAIVVSDKTEPGLNKRLGEWAAKEIWGDGGRGFEKFCTMAVTDNDRLVAVAVYHNYDPDCGVVEISSASISKLWLTRPILKTMFETAYIGLGCQTVVIRVSPSDKPMQRMLKSYGFTCTIIPRLRGRHEDDMIFTLTDDAWRTNKFNMKVYHSGKSFTPISSAA